MNREQWQQKRGRAGARSVPIVITVAEVAHHVDVADFAVGSARPAAMLGGQVPAEGAAGKVCKAPQGVRHRKS